MKVKIVKASEFLNEETNPSLCLSPFRAFSDCHKCGKFLNFFSHSRESRLKCKPQLNPKIKSLMEQRREKIREHKVEISKFTKEIREIERGN